MEYVMKSFAPCLALGLLAIPLLSPAQVTKQGNGYLFRMKFTKGQVMNYKLTSQSTGATPNPINVGMAMSMNVKKVSNGKATVDVKMGSMTMNGQPMNSGAPMVQTMTMDTMGAASGGNIAGSFGGNYPAKAIPVGGTWSAKVPVQAPGAMGGNMAATYKFLGFQNVGGKQVAKVGMTMTGVSSGSGTMLISAVDGSLISTNVTTTTKMGNPQTGKPIVLKSTIKVSRV